MSFTADVKLPTYEELECPVVNVTSAALRAGSFHLAKYCDLQFKVGAWTIAELSRNVLSLSVCVCLGIHALSTGIGPSACFSSPLNI